MIHPTAIIDPAAKLGRDVAVGPYTVIEGAAQIGDRCTIQAHAVIGEYVEMGEDNLIGYGTVIVRGVGSALEPIRAINDPLTFRSHLTTG